MQKIKHQKLNSLTRAKIARTSRELDGDYRVLAVNERHTRVRVGSEKSSERAINCERSTNPDGGGPESKIGVISLDARAVPLLTIRVYFQRSRSLPAMFYFYRNTRVRSRGHYLANGSGNLKDKKNNLNRKNKQISLMRLFPRYFRGTLLSRARDNNVDVTRTRRLRTTANIYGSRVCTRTTGPDNSTEIRGVPRLNTLLSRDTSCTRWTKSNRDSYTSPARCMQVLHSVHLNIHAGISHRYFTACLRLLMVKTIMPVCVLSDI